MATKYHASFCKWWFDHESGFDTIPQSLFAVGFTAPFLVSNLYPGCKDLQGPCYGFIIFHSWILGLWGRLMAQKACL